MTRLLPLVLLLAACPPDDEITLEARPGTFRPDAGFRFHLSLEIPRTAPLLFSPCELDVERRVGSVWTFSHDGGSEYDCPVRPSQLSAGLIGWPEDFFSDGGVYRFVQPLTQLDGGAGPAIISNEVFVE